MVSTIWGICFSLEANPSGSSAKSFHGFATVGPGLEAFPLGVFNC
jgi:hypothetical protein